MHECFSLQWVPWKLHPQWELVNQHRHTLWSGWCGQYRMRLTSLTCRLCLLNACVCDGHVAMPDADRRILWLVADGQPQKNGQAGLLEQSIGRPTHLLSYADRQNVWKTVSSQSEEQQARFLVRCAQLHRYLGAYCYLHTFKNPMSQHAILYQICSDRRKNIPLSEPTYRNMSNYTCTRTKSN